MDAPPPTPIRARRLVPILFSLLALVAIVHLAIGLPDFLLFGLVGGLALCLLVVLRDSLLTARQQLERQDKEQRRDGEK